MEDFVSMFIRVLACSFLFLWSLCLALGSEFGSIPFFSLLWKCLRWVDINSLTVWYNSPGKTSDPGLLFIERVLITDSIFLFVIGLFRLSTSS